MSNDTEYERVVNFDPIAEFQKISGKPHAENTHDEDLDMLGFAMSAHEHKEAVQKQAGDTTFCMSGEAYQANIEAFGFREIYSEDFKGSAIDGGHSDVLKVLWHEPWGLLLYFDTYMGERNGGKVWYNWQPPEGEKRNCSVISSGCMHQADSGESVWVGYHDCRESIRYRMLKLNANGTFLSQWKFPQRSLWVTHYGEKDEVFAPGSGCTTADERSAERIRKFPKSVQDAICFTN